ncbi:MAG TPA: response regulator [Candidatus Sulfotelmatobacter sp.]|nr:response regulator [Candidatus Sulfotelmatobacter sp.]
MSALKAKRPTIALIEDEPLLRMALATAVGDAGYEVTAAASGVEGLALLRERAVDLAIVDLGLPGRLDGLAMVREARRDNPSLRVILTSGMPPRDAELPAADAFLLKPYRVGELLEAIARKLAPTRLAGPAGPTPPGGTPRSTCPS